MSSMDFKQAKEGFGALAGGWENTSHIKIILGLCIGTFLCYHVIVRIYQMWFHPLAKFPGPPLMAVFYLPYLYHTSVKGSWCREVKHLHDKYGPVVRVGPNHLALDGSIAWPEVFAHRSGGRAEYSKQPEYFPGGDANLIGASREPHRRQRRQLNYAFSEAALKEQEGLITRYVDLLMERLAEHAIAGQLVNIVDWLNFTTFDIIGDLTFADSFHSLESNGYHPWVLTIFKGIRGAAIGRLLRAYLQQRLASFAAVYSSAMRLYQENRTFSQEKTRARMSSGAEPRNQRRDFMTYMMRKNRSSEIGMTEHEILTTSPLLVVAGSETTATALSGFWFYLLQNPSVYKTVAKEVQSKVATEEDINMKSTASLEYLHACLEETIRVYPPVAETPPRVSPGDIIHGHYVPAGTNVTVCQWATFRNPSHFFDPEAFRLERWLSQTHPLYDDVFRNDNISVFKPFSHGSRDCIGKNLAYAEMRLIAARLIYRFDFGMVDNQEDWPDVQTSYTIWQKGPLNLTLTQRELS